MIIAKKVIVNLLRVKIRKYLIKEINKRKNANSAMCKKRLSQVNTFLVQEDKAVAAFPSTESSTSTQVAEDTPIRIKNRPIATHNNKYL